MIEYDTSSCSVCSGVESGINTAPMMKSTTDKTHTPTDAARLGKRAHVGRMSPTTAHTNTATDAVTRIIPMGNSLQLTCEPEMVSGTQIVQNLPAPSLSVPYRYLATAPRSAVAPAE